jgi:hypothetical protein
VHVSVNEKSMRPARPTAFAFRRSLLPLHSRPNPDSHRRDAASQGRTGRGQRIAIVTDAWKPQINGVVTTLTETSRCLREAGHTVELMTPLSFWRVPLPDLSGDTPEPVSRPATHAHARRVRTRARAHRDRGSARPRRAQLLPAPAHAIHDVLSHAVPAIPARAAARADVVVLRISALVPRPRAANARRDRVDASRPPRQRL